MKIDPDVIVYDLSIVVYKKQRFSLVFNNLTPCSITAFLNFKNPAEKQAFVIKANWKKIINVIIVIIIIIIIIIFIIIIIITRSYY